MTLNTLEPVQQIAATGTKNIQLVLAGPGSGNRLDHLVWQGVDRRRILALTFTKKDADEMRSRIAMALNLPTAADMSVATFHGFSFRHLRSNPQLAGLSENFALWDTARQRHVFSSRRMWWNEETDILDIIAGAKERLLNAAGLAAELGQDDEVRPGELVTKQELMALVWPNLFVEPANFLSMFLHCAALRDGRDGNRFIINIPGRGYCFVMSTVNAPSSSLSTLPALQGVAPIWRSLLAPDRVSANTIQCPSVLRRAA